MVSYDIPKSALVISHGADAASFFAALCRRGGFALELVDSLDEATRFLSRALPNLVVLDGSMDVGDSLEWVRRLRSDPRTSSTSLVFTSLRGSADAAVTALDSGADDYAPRSGSGNELLARIRAVMRCRAPELAGDEIVFGPLIVRPCEREVLAVVRGAQRRAKVGPTEFRLLHFLAAYPETVHSRNAIRSRLWGVDQPVSERTVDAHVRRLRGSLEPVGLQALIETVLHSGYRLTLPGRT